MGGSIEKESGKLQSATFLIHASSYEGMSNVILEALASGLPVIASKIPGNDELIEDGKNGFLFEPATDATKLADRILPVEIGFLTIIGTSIRY
jgi:glycosyltransferase involved in cell wall biosynthesis